MAGAGAALGFALAADVYANGIYEAHGLRSAVGPRVRVQE
jgi:hypothetical protein